jgi:hypothetical protein
VIVVALVRMVVTWGHLDDALVMLALLVTVRVLRDPPSWAVGRAWWIAGLTVGLGIAAKPIALPAVALLAALHSHRTRAVVLAAVVAAAAWLPFVVAAPGMLTAAAGFRIDVTAFSVLAAVGVSGPTPSWVRPGQLALATTLTFLLARRGLVLPAMVAVVVGRLALEPGWFAYHGAGLVIVLCVWELADAPWRLPLGSAACLVLVVEGIKLGLPYPAETRLVLMALLLGWLALLALGPQSRARWGLTSRMRARSPLTNDGDSSVESDFASSTASEMATAAGTSSDHSSS